MRVACVGLTNVPPLALKVMVTRSCSGVVEATPVMFSWASWVSVVIAPVKLSIR